MGAHNWSGRSSAKQNIWDDTAICRYTVKMWSAYSCTFQNSTQGQGMVFPDLCEFPAHI